MHNPNEQWQVEVNGEIYDSTFAELTVWIAERSLLPDDKVRRGNLRWLQAGRVPPLKPFFEAEANGTEPPQLNVTVTDAGSDEKPYQGETRNLAAPVAAAEPVPDAAGDQAPAAEPDVDASVCSIHPELEAVFLCEGCDHG
ncbi:MAG: hypothetical protein OEM82_07990, partial [Acidobacteriota bacterium]|nr:hypothetical protein [Acidobacteriota bacterium]